MLRRMVFGAARESITGRKSVILGRVRGQKPDQGGFLMLKTMRRRENRPLRRPPYSRLILR